MRRGLSIISTMSGGQTKISGFFSTKRPADEEVARSPPKSLKTDDKPTSTDISPNKENVDTNNTDGQTDVTTPEKNVKGSQENEHKEDLVLSPEQKTRMEDNRLKAMGKLLEKQTSGLCRDIGLSWLKALEGEFKKPYFEKLGKFVDTERQKHKVFPPSENVFSWTRACCVDDLGKFVDTERQKHKVFPPSENVFSWTRACCVDDLGKFVETERQNHKEFPHSENVFSWTRACCVDDVKVVILGQDPYHGPNQAHGLCFSVLPGIQAPPSLVNMYKELEKDIDGFKRPSHGYLQGWAKQGVLMLNAVMTVRAHQANSHKDQGWEKFTDATISYLNNNTEGLVFILWGSYAQKKGAKINKKKHCVLTGVHPSPLSAHRGFFGCKHFSKCNEYLHDNGKTEIDWTHLPVE